MPSTPVTASSPLITGSSSGYQAIDIPEEEEIEEIRPIPVSDNQAEGMEQGRGNSRFFFNASTYSPRLKAKLALHRADLLVAAENCDVFVKNIRKQTTLFSLSALIALVTMKAKGYVEEHPIYFWFIFTNITLSYLMALGGANLIKEQTDFIKRTAERVR